MTADIRSFGQRSDGTEVQAITLSADQLRVTVLTHGATVQDVRLAGVPWPLTLGSAQLAAYEGPMRYFGAVVGPVANRIARARARIAGQEFRFDANERGRTTLHGGSSGTDARHWQIADAGSDWVRLVLDLPDMEGGFPGNRRIAAEFRLDAPATLTLRLSAQTDAPTLMNLANHSFWNLDGRSDTAGHHLRIAAEQHLPVDPDMIPTGEAAATSGTHFDLRKGRVLDNTPRYDHNLCLAAGPRPLAEVATLTGMAGVRMRLDTTEPGLQVYDAGSLDTGFALGLMGQPYGPFAGIALEAQRWPDAPNQPGFPSIRLDPGQVHEQVTRFRFDRLESSKGGRNGR